jgi:hypothetical protein
MKKILPIGYIMIAVLIILAASMMFLGPIIGNVFSEVNNSLAGVAIYPAGGYDMAVTSADGSSVPAPNVKRIVIQNADLSIVVADVDGRMKNIQVMAQQMGGYVVSSNLYRGYTNNYVEVPEAQITIRVPAEKLEDALNQIKKDTVEVQTETRSGQDVTAEYVDLQSRLKNLEAAEKQLDEILQNATETEDVVNVFNQLVYYREQIELVKGQIKYYEEAAALSAISVRIVAEATVQPLVIGKWEPKGVALEAVQDLSNFLKGFVEILIRFVIYTLPVWIIIGIPLYLVFIGARAVFRKMRGNKPKEEQPQETSIEKK